MEKSYVDLHTLQMYLREGIEESFPDKLWVKAEISSINARSNGHCYLDLSQNEGSVAVAKARAVIWKSRYNLLRGCFRNATGSDLCAGMTILAHVQVTYSELYGLTLVIDDIDADVTLGEQERIRRETIAKLQADGLIDAQSRLQLPQLPYRLAVISAKDAAGFGDFCHHLLDNEYGFRYQVDLFEAIMQGVNAPESIVDALESVQTSDESYDAILIMRGGGSAFDLSCFDDYALCFSIANCDIPVMTAIGHDRDRHVADMVSFLAVKTPTALADELLSAYMAEDERIASFGTRLRLAFLSKISSMESRVGLLESRIKAADPRNILSRGYALVTDGRGVVLKSASGIKEGDRVGVLFSDGTLDCTVDGRKI